MIEYTLSPLFLSNKQNIRSSQDIVMILDNTYCAQVQGQLHQNPRQTPKIKSKPSSHQHTVKQAVVSDQTETPCQNRFQSGVELRGVCVRAGRSGRLGSEVTQVKSLEEVGTWCSKMPRRMKMRNWNCIFLPCWNCLLFFFILLEGFIVSRRG